MADLITRPFEKRFKRDARVRFVTDQNKLFQSSHFELCFLAAIGPSIFNLKKSIFFAFSKSRIFQKYSLKIPDKSDYYLWR